MASSAALPFKSSARKVICSAANEAIQWRASTYSRVWQEARSLGLPPNHVNSPLAGRPYDLRHAGVSLWLNAGVHAPEVAERAGHSVDVLLKVYAKCIDGDATLINQRIESALAV